MEKNKDFYQIIILVVTYFLFILGVPLLSSFTYQKIGIDYEQYKLYLGLIAFAIICLIFLIIKPKLLKGYIAIIVYIFLTSIITAFLPIPNNIPNIILQLLLLLPSIITLIILILMNLKTFQNKLTEFKKDYKNLMRKSLEYWGYAVITMLLINTFISTFLINELPGNEAANRELIAGYPLYAILSSIIIAPLSEELSFRASFKNAFNNKILFALATGILFGIFHVLFQGDYIYSLSYAGFGFFLGKLYYETDNILTTIFAHTAHNALCIILIFLGGLA